MMMRRTPAWSELGAPMGSGGMPPPRLPRGWAVYAGRLGIGIATSAAMHGGNRVSDDDELTF